MRFLLVDRFESLEPGVRATGVKAIPIADPTFQDHFPGNPVYPGVLLLESLAQTAGGLLTLSCDFERFALMVMVQDTKFRDFVKPGCLLRTSVEIESREEGTARVVGRARVEEREVARARLTFVLRPLDEVVAPAYQEFWKAHMRGLLPPATGASPAGIGFPARPEAQVGSQPDRQGGSKPDGQVGWQPDRRGRPQPHGSVGPQPDRPERPHLDRRVDP